MSDRLEPFGTVAMAIYFCDEGKAGRISPLDALDHAKAELDLFQKIAKARDGQVSENTAGLTTRNPSSTSARAAAKVAVHSGTQRARILAEICETRGLTDFELSHRLRLLASSVRPRRLELVQGGYLRDSGTTRRHRDTSWTVWQATSEGLAWYARQSTEEAA